MIRCKASHLTNEEKEEELRHIIGDEPLLDEKAFILLLCSRMAENSNELYLNKDGNNIKKCLLPLNYRDAIDDIMNDTNAIDNYSSIIDIPKYYFNNDNWYKDIYQGIRNILDSNMYDYEYNCTTGTLSIDFMYCDRKKISDSFDEDIISKVDDFSIKMTEYFKEEEYELIKAF